MTQTKSDFPVDESAADISESSPTDSQEAPPRPRFPVVGIVASAGGLNAFKRFLTAMPEDSGVAVILVPHLDPAHKSMMVSLLARQTKLPVVEAAHGMVVQPNHVWLNNK